jgi:ubiquinone/menaquinone biosynthesis C-methylase UbiE
MYGASARSFIATRLRPWELHHLHQARASPYAIRSDRHLSRDSIQIPKSEPRTREFVVPECVLHPFTKSSNAQAAYLRKPDNLLCIVGERALDSARVESFADQVFQAMIGFQKVAGIYLGDKLGFYRSLHENGPATSVELAARTGTDERYVREWLEYQAVNGILEVDNASAGPTERRFCLTAEHGAVLAEPEHTYYLGAAGLALVGSIRPIDQIVDGYRTGAGVPYEEYGEDMVCGVAAFNRPTFMNSIGQEWIPAMPDVDAVLRQPGARVADVGMGMAWSSIAIARAYPNATVDGFDLDEQSVALANENIAEAGLSDRVVAQVRDAGDPDLSGQYDLAIAIECIHDMSNPVAALASMRRLVGDRGAVLVVDERVQEVFTAPADEVEQFMYGFSVVHCLQVGRVETPSVATGTVIRRSTMETYAREAGFSEIEELAIENPFYRFYRMRG